MEFKMAPRSEPTPEQSVEDLLADPIVRDLMIADCVDPTELKALLDTVRRAVESRAKSRPREKPTCFAGIIKRATRAYSGRTLASTISARNGGL
jgi:hypothetical protein